MERELDTLRRIRFRISTLHRLCHFGLIIKSLAVSFFINYKVKLIITSQTSPQDSKEDWGNHGSDLGKHKVKVIKCNANVKCY
jgi:hypothetical protein